MLKYNFGGKVALVTGGGGRIGSRIAEQFAESGARVAVHDKTLDAAQKVAAQIAKRGGSASAFAADLLCVSEIYDMVERVAHEMGVPSILVNNAGAYPNCAVLDMSLREWDTVYDLNVRAPFVLSQQVARRLVELKRPGCIVNISSGAGSSARLGAAHYSGSKAALEMLTRVMAMELGEHAIRVVCIAPGLITDEPLFISDDRPRDEYVNTLLSSIPLGRTGVAEDISRAVLWAASDDACWVTGTVIGVDGGSQSGRTHLPYSRHTL